MFLSVEDDNEVLLKYEGEKKWWIYNYSQNETVICVIHSSVDSINRTSKGHLGFPLDKVVWELEGV